MIVEINGVKVGTLFLPRKGYELIIRTEVRTYKTWGDAVLFCLPMAKKRKDK
jgi:hypothetical protein